MIKNNKDKRPSFVLGSTQKMKHKIGLLIFLLLNSYMKSQNYFGEYSIRSGFCSTTINLWADSTFFIEYGCEGRSNITYGDFSILNSQLILTPTRIDQVQLIYRIEWIRSLNDTTINIPTDYPVFVLLDKNNELVENQEVVFYGNNGGYITVEETKHAWGIYPFGISEEIYFPHLSKLFRRFVSAKIPPKPDDKSLLRIVFNFKATFLRYNEVLYDANEHQENKLYFQNGTLRSESIHGLIEFKKEDGS